MHKQLKPIFSSSAIALAAAMMVGCGGSGTSSNFVATKLADSYTVTIVPAPAGANGMQFNAVSPTGDFAYGSYVVNNSRHVFKYAGGTVQELTDGSEDLNLQSISDKGVGGGYYDDNGPSYPFMLEGSSLSTPGLLPNSTEGWVSAVSGDGTVFTSYDWNDGTYKSYMTKNGVSTQVICNAVEDLGVAAVSPSGMVDCWVKEGGSYIHKMYDPKTSNWQNVLTGATSVYVTAINDSGTIVGNEKIGGQSTAFIEVGGVRQNFLNSGSNYSLLSAVNAGNVAVGSDKVDVSGTMSYRAHGWDQTNGYVDLNTRLTGVTGFYAQSACDIDTRGRIYGLGYKDGVQVAYILTPVAP